VQKPTGAVTGKFRRLPSVCHQNACYSCVNEDSCDLINGRVFSLFSSPIVSRWSCLV